MTTQAPPIRVAIIEDQHEIRDGLKTLISGTPGYRVTGAWRSIEDALEEIAREVPDVALVDIGLPGMPGTEGIRILKERYPKLRALMLTVYDDDERIFRAICAGASGYLLKSTPPFKLLESLREVMTGGAPMSPTVASQVLSLFREFRPLKHTDRHLSPHETRLLSLLVDGHNLKTAAAELRVSRATVAWHLHNIYEKLQVHSKSEAVAKALRSGLIR
ncbi:MAG TPA: response regulator transcription factor [Bryobacteraceae bacterium]|nr:response regulator transcription factor [Bryobacteraceae bacterium]